MLHRLGLRIAAIVALALVPLVIPAPPASALSGAVLDVGGGLVQFGYVDAGSYRDQALTIANAGDSELDLFDMETISGRDQDFDLVGGSCLDLPTVMPGGRCELTFRFEPSFSLPTSAVVRLHSNGGSKDIRLEGAGRPNVSGYWMVGADGTVYPFGAAQSWGNAPVIWGQITDLEPRPNQRGYWILDEAGHVHGYGDAKNLGGVVGMRAGERATSLSSTPTGNGYWIFTSQGRVFPTGDAVGYGDMGGTPLNGPVLDSVPTPSGRGYYMVGSDGGIFAFGDAVFRGSMGGTRLNAPVQSLVPDADGMGYWLVASDGGIFTFDAGFYGSMGSVRLNRPITGMVGFPAGYLMVGEDGGIFAFGDATFHGSLGANPPARPIVAVAAVP